MGNFLIVFDGEGKEEIVFLLYLYFNRPRARILNWQQLFNQNKTENRLGTKQFSRLDVFQSHSFTAQQRALAHSLLWANISNDEY